MEACEGKCTALGEEKCAAFSFCDGSNCKGSCSLYPPPLEQYTRCNGYPGSTCYVRPQKARSDAELTEAPSHQASTIKTDETSEATPTLKDGSGPGPKDKLVESFEIDLDLPPEERWAHVIEAKRVQILGLLDILRPLFRASKDSAEVTDELIAAYNASSQRPEAPQYIHDYLAEMRGIAAVLAKEDKVTLSDVLMANLFYEIDSAAKTPLSEAFARSCTSLVAQSANGTTLFARNQDYPPPFTLVMIHAVFKRRGVTVYEGTTYAGTVGLSTAFSHAHDGGRGWAVSVNARDIPAGWPAQGTEAAKVDAVEAARTGAAILPILTRQAADAGMRDYNAALRYFARWPSILPGYLIVGGGEPGEGAIVSHNGSRTGSEPATDSDVFALFATSMDGDKNGGWFVVQTNTDHWKPAPLYPGSHPPASRRATAIRGLVEAGQERISADRIWDVLSTPPTFNADTIHTDLVDVAAGSYRTYKRNGPLAKVWD